MCAQIAALAAWSSGGIVSSSMHRLAWLGASGEQSEFRVRLVFIRSTWLRARIVGMTDGVGGATEAAALAAREKLGAIAGGAARDEHGAGRVARVALFDEALLAALRARFAELRMVAK
jgi:hypothetical protein